MIKDIPTFVIRPLTHADAQHIAQWHYDPPYDFYDFRADPEDLAELLTPQNWGTSYFAVDGDGHLVGFFQFCPLHDTVEIGLGLRPDLIGRGWGVPFLQTGLAFAAARFQPVWFRLRVASFNQRAIRVYQRLGFCTVKLVEQATNGGSYAFLEMQRKAADEGLLAG